MPATSGPLTALWTAIGTHLWQTSLLLLALLAVAALMRRAPARLVNALLFIGLAKLLVPLPLLKRAVGGVIDSAVRGAASSEALGRVTAPIIQSTAAVLDPASVVTRTGASPFGRLPLVMTLVWTAGVAAIAVVWIVRSRVTRMPVTTALSEASPAVRDGVGRALSGTGVRPELVVVTEAAVMPHVAGLVRPRIVLPARLVRAVGAEELRGIILHENAHRVRREPARLLLSRAAVLAFFFYPLLWPLLKRLRETSEMACDDAALDAGIEPGAYARALASVVDMGLCAAPSGAAIDRGRPSLLCRRLLRLEQAWRCKMQTRHRIVLTLMVAFVVLASALALTSFAGDATTAAKAPPPPPKEAPVPPDAPAPLPEPEEFFIRKMVPPDYPEAAREAGLEAIVFLELTLAEDLSVVDAVKKTIIVGRPPLEVIKVGKDGKVVEPVEEEGMEAYHEFFIQSAVEAALQWEIEARPEGARVSEPVLVVPIQFRLEDKGEEEGGEGHSASESRRLQEFEEQLVQRMASREASATVVEDRRVQAELERARVELQRTERALEAAALEAEKAELELARVAIEAERAAEEAQEQKAQEAKAAEEKQREKVEKETPRPDSM